MLISFLISSVDALASLPYIGPNNKSCNVNVPTEDHIKDLDSGYLVSEDCNTIYVKPPIKGKIEDQVISETQLAELCGMYNNIIMAANDFFQYETENNRKRQSLSDIISNTKNQKERDEAMEKLIAVNDMIKFSIREINEFGEFLKNHNGQSDVAATLTGNLVLNSADLIEAYKRVNQNKNVVRMPISIGIIDAKLVAPDSMKNDQGMSIYEKLNVKPVVSSRIGGLKLSDIMDDLDSPDQKKYFPDYIKNLSGNAHLMGKMSSVSLVLNNFGYCVMKDSNKKTSEEKISDSLNTYLAPTYTYFYPVQTKATYNLEINVEGTFNIIENLIKTKGSTITSNDIRKAIEEYTQNQAPAVSVSTNPGLFGSGEEAENMRKDYEVAMKNMIIDQIMARISSKIEALKQGAKYNVAITKRGRRCSTSTKLIFFKDTSCRNYSYTVMVERFNLEYFKSGLKDIIAPGGSANAERYVNYIMFDTVVFSPDL